MQTDLRQLDEGGVPAVLIDLIYKSFCVLKRNAQVRRTILIKNLNNICENF